MSGANRLQDWAPVVFRKPPKATERPQGDAAPQGDAHARLARETDELRHARVSKEIGQRVVALRLGLRLTQQQLATKASLPLATVRQYESGAAIPAPAVLGKLASALGVATLRRA